MSWELAIQEAFERLMKKEPNAVICEVVSVNKEQGTCVVKDHDGLEHEDVRFTAVIKSGVNKAIFYPAIGSSVLVGNIENNKDNLYVIAVGELDSFEVDAKIIFNKGDLGGMVISEKTAEQINEIKKDLNALKTVFKSWVIAPSDGGAALKTALAVWFGQNLREIEKTELENEKVKH